MYPYDVLTRLTLIACLSTATDAVAPCSACDCSYTVFLTQQPPPNMDLLHHQRYLGLMRAPHTLITTTKRLQYCVRRCK
ncbi:hypothetical protein EDB89DRAFT_1945564 [Lactarius sanguifluus]|nr:hypothetical protein EDB89DRAFT_1945564 [Lactarius sanguifluus]